MKILSIKARSCIIIFKNCPTLPSDLIYKKRLLNNDAFMTIKALVVAGYLKSEMKDKKSQLIRITLSGYRLYKTLLALKSYEDRFKK